MRSLNLFRNFRNASREVLKRRSHNAFEWIRCNPLKISGISGATAMCFLGYAGELMLENHLMLIGATLYVSAYLTEAIWGRGGEKNSLSQGIIQNNDKVFSKQRIKDTFSIQKCLSCRRFPVESASFQGFLGSIAIIAAGIEPWLTNNTFGIDEALIVSTGALAAVGDFYANCVPESKNRVSPMVKAALFYGLTTIAIAVTAFKTMMLSLFAATLSGTISDIAFACSRRHDNDIKKTSISIPRLYK